MSTWELTVRAATNTNVAILSAALLGYLDPSGNDWLFHFYFWPSLCFAALFTLGLLGRLTSKLLEAA